MQLQVEVVDLASTTVNNTYVYYITLVEYLSSQKS